MPPPPRGPHFPSSDDDNAPPEEQIPVGAATAPWILRFPVEQRTATTDQQGRYANDPSSPSVLRAEEFYSEETGYGAYGPEDLEDLRNELRPTAGGVSTNISFTGLFSNFSEGRY